MVPVLRWPLRYLAYFSGLCAFVICGFGLHFLVDQLLLSMTGLRFNGVVQARFGSVEERPILFPLLLLPVSIGGLVGAALFRIIAGMPWPARASWVDVLYGWFGFLVLLMMTGSGALAGIFTGVEVEIVLIVLLVTLGFAWSVWIHRRAAAANPSVATRAGWFE